MFYDFFFFKQKTSYEMRISDWSSDVCSSDLSAQQRNGRRSAERLCLQHCRVRQVAQHAAKRNRSDWAVQPLANRLWLRTLLRVSRRRDVAIRTSPVQHLHTGRAVACSALTPDRRSRDTCREITATTTQ